jgi:hypothetical protein
MFTFSRQCNIANYQMTEENNNITNCVRGQLAARPANTGDREAVELYAHFNAQYTSSRNILRLGTQGE